MSLICNSWYPRLLLSVFLDSLSFVFGRLAFPTQCLFCYFFGFVKGIGSAPRLTGNSSHRKKHFHPLVLPDFVYISNCILLPLQSYETKVDLQKQGLISSFTTSCYGFRSVILFLSPLPCCIQCEEQRQIWDDCTGIRPSFSFSYFGL
jgi:hypothetical protein